MYKRLQILLLTCIISGCSTIGVTLPTRSPYAGTAYDILYTMSVFPHPYMLFGIIDLPLTFVLDTLVLPYTLNEPTRQINN